MSTLSEAVSDYCASEHFFFLDTALKEHAGALLDHWCQAVGSEVSAASVERGLQEISRLDLPLEIRQAVPHLLKEFCDYLAGRAGFPEAEQWAGYVTQAEADYRASFRQDGTVKGQTVRKKFADVGRNDPCPCGSGVKFKKCCIQLLS